MLAVSFARVYYRCNYIGDTIVRVLIGVAIGALISKCGLKLILKRMFLNYVGVNDDIYSDM